MRSRAARAILGAVVAAGLLLPVPIASPPLTPTAAVASSEALPDLAMAPLRDFQIQWVNGRRLLRFTAMMVNVGGGHFEVRGRRTSTSQPMTVRQIIFTDPSRSTIARRISTNAVAKWSGDGHEHWHVQEMMRYDLWGAPGTTRGAKVGFCFLDSDPHRLSLPGAPSSPYYRGSWCGHDRNALSNRMGISIGWGDEYEWYLAWQWVDITDIPSGTFTLRAKVDPYGFFLEERENNQCAWARVSWTTGSNTVTLRERGRGCVNDWSGSKFASAIAWLWETGITVGCAPDLFCTNNAVRRDQMATFLRRALELPPTSVDYYRDDDGNRHESSINRLAASGITRGCGDRRYCPKGIVNRDQMASFLARAFTLPPATRDHFDDDDGNKHEDAINRLAEAGITVGCGERRYCPRSAVTRGQLAAFLKRVLQ